MKIKKCIKKCLSVVGTTFSFCMSVYIGLTYMLVILPNSAPSDQSCSEHPDGCQQDRQWRTWALIALNYMLHFLFGGTYMLSLLLTCLSDPGSFS